MRQRGVAPPYESAVVAHDLAELPGSMITIVAPTAAPSETADLQEKWSTVAGSVPFGGDDGLVCLRARYQPNQPGGA
jgi:hypothetical protein